MSSSNKNDDDIVIALLMIVGVVSGFVALGIALSWAVACGALSVACFGLVVCGIIASSSANRWREQRLRAGLRESDREKG